MKRANTNEILRVVDLEYNFDDWLGFGPRNWSSYDDYECECCSCSDDRMVTCPDCGTVTFPLYGFGHYPPECPSYAIMMVHEEAV